METMIKADLHLHSSFSDGELEPAALVRMAAASDFEIIAITDHDTAEGIPEALEAGRNSSVRVIPGIEITVRFKRDYFRGSLHVLAYWNEELQNSSEFQRHLNSTVSSGRGHSLVESRVHSINREFGPEGRSPLLQRDLTVEEIESLAKNVSRRHFAIALSQGHGLSREQVSMLIGNDSPAYLPSGIELGVLAGFLRDWPLVPVLAHPAAGSFPGESHYREVLPPLEIVQRILPEFLDAGIMGLEVYYPGHTEEHRDYLLSLAAELGLVVTGGSDMHDTDSRPLMKPGFVGDVSDFLRLLEETVIG